MLDRSYFYDECSEEEMFWLRTFVEGCAKSRLKLSHLHTILPSIIRRMKDGQRYAEIGSHVGGSALTVKYADRKRKIFCYDFPDAGWGGIEGSNKMFRRNLAGFSGVYYSTGDSHSAVMKQAIKFNAPYGVFLVDGDHSDEGAYEDLELAYSCLEPDGYLVFDDISHHPYLRQTFIRFCGNNKIDKYITIDHLTGSERKYNFERRGVAILRK